MKGEKGLTLRIILKINYSLRKQSVGLIRDALNAWKATVSHATIKATNPAPAKYQGCNDILNANVSSHIFEVK
jgi:hypothetical protein